MDHPLKIGDRVRHAGQRYATEATATVERVASGIGGWEYVVCRDKPECGSSVGYWHSTRTIFVSRPTITLNVDADTANADWPKGTL